MSTRKEPFPPKRLRDKRWVQSELQNPDSTEKPRLLNPLLVSLPDATESGLCDLLNPKGLGLGKCPVLSFPVFLFSIALPLSVWLCFFGVCFRHAMEWSGESLAVFCCLRRTVRTQTGQSDAQSPHLSFTTRLSNQTLQQTVSPSNISHQRENQTDV